MGSAIEIRDVSKRFRLYHDKPRSLKERVIRLGRIPYEEFWALKGITLDVEAGETVGILGHNGSGKSTLLKCVSGIMRPTTGSIKARGRTAALLELGSGFHPELTGRENVYLNGSILGLSRRDVERVYDSVVDFAEIEQFMDHQVKHYSSGMYARLAFALAINVDPEILVVDEVLAVGDEAFQRKCLERIRDFRREGRTILLVTHASGLVRQICDRAAVFEQGEMIALGDPPHAVRIFQDSLLKRGLHLEEGRAPADWRFTMAVRILDVELVLPAAGRAYLLPDEPLDVRMTFQAPEPVDDAVFAINVHDQSGNLLLGTNTDQLGVTLPTLHGEGELTFHLDRVGLLDGAYMVSVGIHNLGGVDYDRRSDRDFFEVLNPTPTIGLVHFPVRAELRLAGDAPVSLRGAPLG